MRTWLLNVLLLIIALVPSSFAGMNDESPAPEQPESQDIADESPVDASGVKAALAGVRTLGGRQLWGDVVFFRGWRIQQNVLTKHYRLLDDNDNRFASGTLDECQTRLKEVREEQKLPAMKGRAVILIHGIGRSSKCFNAMAAKLKDEDCTIVGFDYPSTRVPIQASAAYLHSVLQSLEGIQSIDVVAHSMGGLLLRSYLSKYKEPRFHRAVLVGVPNKGAQMADFLKNNPLFKAFFGPAGQQLVTGKDGLVETLPTPEFEFGVMAGGRSQVRGFNPLLPGDNDSTVTVASTRLPGAADFLLLPVIHSFLMTDKSGIAAVQNFLKHGRFDPDRPPEPISADDISVIE